jgi:hypothetical protein
VTTSTTTTTEAPAETTTEAAPPETTTAAAPETTTTAAAPETTTTAAAPETTTTAAAPETTTTAAAPETTTTAAAPETTTTAAAPETTTTAAAPETTTTAAPSSSTTAASGDAPTVGEVTVGVDPDDGADHHATSIQVAGDAKLTLTWSTQNATGVRIDPLGSFGASDTIELPTEDATYSIVALGENGAESDPYTVEIHTHEPGEVVSQHVDVLSGVAKLISYEASPEGQVAPGQEVVVSVVATLDTDSVSVDDQDVPLTDTGDGHKAGSLTVTAPDASGEVTYTLKAVKDGDAADTQTITISLAPSSTTSTTAAPSSTTTAGPSSTTTAASTSTTTTTAPPSSTTTQGGTLENPSWGAGQYFHGQSIALQVDAPGVPDESTVYFAVEIDAGGGAWKPLQKAQAQVKDGKAAVSVVLEDSEETGDGGDELCHFRFHASLEELDDAPSSTTTAV